MDPRAKAIVLILAAFLTLPLLFGTTFPGGTFLIVPTFLLTVWGAEEMRKVAENTRWLLGALVGLSGAVAVLSVLTGFLNGLSDEPYSTPAYASLGWSLYLHPVAFSYVQYGRTLYENSYDVYLPLLTFVQIPGIDYRWVSLLAWGGTLFVLRGHPRAVAGFASPWIALLAANGQNDYVPLLALSVALVVPLGSYSWLGEAFALALKQLANVVVFLYHLARREYLRAVATVAITVAILAPFLLLDPGSVWCHVVVGDPGPGCVGHSWTFFVFKRNYWLYPSWVAVVFYEPLRGWASRGWGRLRARFAPSLASPADLTAPTSVETDAGGPGR
jgi:hypothetical protein